MQSDSDMGPPFLSLLCTPKSAFDDSPARVVLC